MSNYQTLLGSEEVSRAGHNMNHAAKEMINAASSIEQACQQHTASLERFIIDFTSLVERLEKLNEKA